MTSRTKLSLLVLLLLLVGTEAYLRFQEHSVAEDSESEIAALFDSGQSGRMVSGTGTVVRLLDDDRDGSRHQRFVVRLANDMTVLISHNIDIASRVPVAPGATVHFRGQYEWNSQGGVVHWTHHDPDGHHAEGWLEVDGRRYD